MGDRPRDVGSSRARPPLDVERFHISDRVAMLAALRVVLGLPRVIPNSGDYFVRDVCEKGGSLRHSRHCVEAGKGNDKAR